MKADKSRFLLALVMLFTVSRLPAQATSPVEKQVKANNSPPGAPQTSEAAITRELALLENRFFFHSYGHDPVEKRIERIELLILGSGQIGSVAERVEALKKAVAVRDSESAKTIREAKKPDGPSNYPVVTSLEWRVLKKTFPQESLDQRLNRLESQLFGSPATAMSYVDRIERLKKTTGLGVALEAQAPASRYKMGPLPRTSRGLPVPVMPFQDGDNEGGDGLKFFKNGNSFGWTYRGGNMPPGMVSPFSGLPNNLPNSQGGEPRGLSDLMDDMNRQMTEMLKRFGSSDDFFPGFPSGGSGSANPGQVFPGPNFPGNGLPGRNFPGELPDMPGHPKSPGGNFKVVPKEEVPPYSDPNSI